MLNLICGMRSELRLSTGDRMAQFQTLAFDPSIQEGLAALCSGATLVMPTADWLQTTESFRLRCEEHHVTIVDISALLWRRLARQAGFTVPYTLRCFLIRGDRPDPLVLATWFESRDPLPALVIAYGPSCIPVTTALDHVKRAEVPYAAIGQSLPDLCMELLDQRGRSVPAGVTGEIYIGGVGIARGGLCGTGDFARRSESGALSFMGRKDQQLQLGGMPVSCDEIELWLRLFPHIEDAVITVRETGAEKRLVAYIACGQYAPAPEQLRSYLSIKLPEHLIPSTFVFLEALPLTLNDRIDRGALPDPVASAVTSISEEAPLNKIEEVVAGIWKELLQIKRLSREDNFFDLGGNTVLAVQMGERLQDHFGIDMHFVNIPRRSSLKLLARAIASELVVQRDASDVSLRAHDSSEYSDAELQRLLREEALFGR